VGAQKLTRALSWLVKAWASESNSKCCEHGTGQESKWASGRLSIWAVLGQSWKTSSVDRQRCGRTRLMFPPPPLKLLFYRCGSIRHPLTPLPLFERVHGRAQSAECEELRVHVHLCQELCTIVCRSSPSCIARRSLGVTTLFIHARRVSFFVRLRRVLQDRAFTKPCEGVHTSKIERLKARVSLTMSWRLRSGENDPTPLRPWNKAHLSQFYAHDQNGTLHTNLKGMKELTDGCYSGGDSQGLPGFIHPRVLGIPTISFQ